MHTTRPCEELFTLITSTACAAGLSTVDRGVATIVGAALAGESYCPLAWGNKLANVAR